MGVTAAGRSVGGWCPVVDPIARGRVMVAHEVHRQRRPRDRGSRRRTRPAGRSPAPRSCHPSRSHRLGPCPTRMAGVRHGARSTGPRWRKR